MLKKKNKLCQLDWRKLPIQTLVAGVFMIFIITPFIALSVIFIMVYEDYAKKSFSQYMVEALSGVERQTTESYQRIVDGTMNFYHSGIVDILDKPVITEEENIAIIKKLEELQLSYNNSVASIMVKKGDKLYWAGGSYLEMERMITPFEDQIKKRKGRHIWMGPFFMIPKSKSGEKMILAKALNGQKQKNIAQAFLVVDIEVFTKMFNEDNLKKVAKYLYDASGTLLYSEGGEVASPGLQAKQLPKGGESGYEIVKINGVRSLAVNVTSAKTGWTLATSMPMSQVLEDFKPIKVMLGALALVYIIFLLGMITLLDKYVILPIHSLTESMDFFASGKMNAMVNVPAIGEMEKLNRHFNKMTIRIGELIKRNEEEVKEKNEFKMETLRAQLNPHFIYNSLNTIKWMAAINKQDNIQSLTEALIQLLMNSTKGKEQDYSLQDEMQLIEYYGIIQKARFMNFDIQYDVEQAASTCKIFKFLIQPIVENSIIHGFSKGKRSRGIITITAYCEQNLHIIVEDNGQGFDVETWNSAEEKTDKNHTNIAVKNIRQMIELEYGAGYGLFIESEIGKGTRAVYKLPVIK